MLEHLVRGCRLAHDLHVGALCDHALQALADDTAIVCDQQLDPGGRRVERRVGRHDPPSCAQKCPVEPHAGATGLESQLLGTQSRTADAPPSSALAYAAT